MSRVSENIIKAMLIIRDAGLFPLPDVEDTDINMLKARMYNRKHPRYQPKDSKAVYHTIYVGGYDCLTITPKIVKDSSKGILYLHGGGDKNTWEAELSIACKYGEKTGRIVYYPLYPAISEASLTTAADYVYVLFMQLYDLCKGKISVIGTSYGDWWRFN